MEDENKTKDSFGFQWQYFSGVNKKKQIQILAQRTGLLPNEIKGKTILDAGCGKGRYILAFSDFKPKKIVGVDYSDAVKVAKQHTKKMKNVRIYKKDLLKLDLKEKFDIIFSDGVLHHTGNTKKAFFTLLKNLKKGGTFYVMIYEKQNPIKEINNKILRAITTRMPRNLLLKISHLLVFIDKIPLINKVGRMFFNFGPIAQDNFDWYSPAIQDHHTEKEVIQWFKKAGFRDIRILSHPKLKTPKKEIAALLYGKNGGIIRIIGRNYSKSG